MHPHWYSSSVDVQRRLISLFIHSLAPKSPYVVLAPSSSAFENEVGFTRDPHDVAAVLRWGIRHLQLENDSFGIDDQWYKIFFDSESNKQHPEHAFSEILAPLIPPSHFELLKTTFEILSSLAAHAEANSTSGGKLSKLFGLWLLAAQRVEEKDDWSTFYDRWERSGRILEHLFLSRIRFVARTLSHFLPGHLPLVPLFFFSHRDQALIERLPVRLLELVQHYPYSKLNSSETDLLPRPRFSTRRYDALLVRLETELPAKVIKPAHKPLLLLLEALNAEIFATASTLTEVWGVIRDAGKDAEASSPGSHPGPGKILSDDSLRLLSLIPIEGDNSEQAFTLFTQDTRTGRSGRPSPSASDQETSTVASHSRPTPNPVSLTSSPIAASPTDWNQFTNTGFSETSPIAKPFKLTLFDTKDVEKTKPRPVSPKRGVRSAISPSRGRKSLDSAAAKIVGTPHPSKSKSSDPPKKVNLLSKTTQVSLVQLDEAFIDFWSDSLLDPVSSNWPLFIICKLKQSLTGVEVDGKRIEWVIIEQIYATPPQPAGAASAESHTTTEGPPGRRPRGSSPKSFASGTLASTKKRFSFFGGSSSSNAASLDGLASQTTTTTTTTTTKTKKKKSFTLSGAASLATPKPSTSSAAVKVGELGEILTEEKEEEEGNKYKAREQVPAPKAIGDSERKTEKNAAGGKQDEKKGAKEVGDAPAIAAVAAASVAAAVGVAVTSPIIKDEAPAVEVEVEDVNPEGPAAPDTVVPAVDTDIGAAPVPVVEQAPAPAAKPPTPVPIIETAPISTAAASVPNFKSEAEVEAGPIIVVEVAAPAPVKASKKPVSSASSLVAQKVRAIERSLTPGPIQIEPPTPIIARIEIGPSTPDSGSDSDSVPSVTAPEVARNQTPVAVAAAVAEPERVPTPPSPAVEEVAVVVVEEAIVPEPIAVSRSVIVERVNEARIPTLTRQEPIVQVVAPELAQAEVEQEDIFEEAAPVPVTPPREPSPPAVTTTAPVFVEEAVPAVEETASADPVLEEVTAIVEGEHA